MVDLVVHDKYEEEEGLYWKLKVVYIWRIRYELNQWYDMCIEAYICMLGKCILIYHKL